MIPGAMAALGFLSKTKLGKKVSGKALGILGRVSGKIGKRKMRAGDGKENMIDFVTDPQVTASIQRTDLTKDQGKVADTIGDFLKQVKDKAGPVETTIGADKSMLYVGGGVLALLVVFMLMKK